MPSVETLLVDACDSKVACLGHRDLWVAIAEQYAESAGKSATELLTDACDSGIACLQPRDLLVVIAQQLSSGEPAPPEPGCIITTNSLPDGMDGDPYFQTVEADGPSVVLTVIAGALPDGLEMGPSGIISGTPTLANTYNFTVQGTPASGAPCTKELSITILPFEPPFGPDSFPGLIQWVDAYQYEGEADMTVVGGPGLEWIDKTGNGHDGASGSGVVQFRTAGIAGTHPALQFTGDSLVFAGITMAGDFTIIVIAETLGDTSWLGNNAANVQIRRRRSGVNNASFFPGAPSEIISDLFTDDDEIMMVVWRRSGTTVSFRENKTARNSGSNGGSFTYNQFGFSQFVGGIGDCGEIMVYDQALSDADLDQLYDDYAKLRWPLP